MEKIQLYQFGPLGDLESASPFCVKVRDAMRYKRVPFDTVNATSPIQVRKLNPRGKLPVMIDDGVMLADWADESLYWHVVYERWQVAEQFAKFAEVVFSPVPAAVRPMVKLLFAR